VQLDYACGVVAIAIPAKTKQQIAIALSCFFSKKADRSFGISQKGRSLFGDMERAINLFGMERGIFKSARNAIALGKFN